VAFSESHAVRIRVALARRRNDEDDDQLRAWIGRATKFVQTLPKKVDGKRP
jgi:hypothetical protein